MADDDTSEVEYVADEGFVRLNLRRPVNLYVPSDQQESYDPTADSEEPGHSLQLDWVNGYRGRDCRSNIYKLESGEIVYFAAAVAIIYNPETKTQRHFIHHTDDIKCLAVHPDGKTVATGQVKGQKENLPHVCIWDSESLEVLHTFGEDTFNRGVSCVAFDKDDGNMLAAVDDSPEPRLSLWRWEDESKVGGAKVAPDPVIGVMFTSESPARVVTSGKNHLAFWSPGGDSGLSKRSAIFGSHEKPKYVTAVSMLPDGEVVTGDSNGNILVWKMGGNTVQRSLAGCHEGSVFFLGLNEDQALVSAGKDKKVVVYSEDLEPTDQTLEIPEEFGSPRVVVNVGDEVFLGTTNNCIIRTSFDENKPVVVTQGHLEELWGIAPFHTKPHFLSAGQDGKVYCRDTESHEILWKLSLEMECQSATVTSCDHVSVIGGSSGKWVAINNDTQETMHEGTAGDEIIQVVRFSPDGNKLALGSRDNTIYVYDFGEDGETFTKRGECEGHSSFITHLDWSTDGELLRTNSGDYEVLFWKSEDCSLETQSEDFKDVEFATNNCILSFTSIGIWPPGTDGTHVNTCNKGVSKPLIASGDDFGAVKLFAFPSSVQNAKFHSYHAHSSHVTTVVFHNEDSQLLTAGGRDNTVMQWKVCDPE